MPDMLDVEKKSFLLKTTIDGVITHITQILCNRILLAETNGNYLVEIS